MKLLILFRFFFNSDSTYTVDFAAPTSSSIEHAILSTTSREKIKIRPGSTFRFFFEAKRDDENVI